MNQLKKMAAGLGLVALSLSLSACGKKPVPAPVPKDLINKTLTFDVYACKTVFVIVSGVKENTPIKDCGDFAAANHRLPQGNESGAGNVQKIGQVRALIEGSKDAINDVSFGVDAMFGQKAPDSSNRAPNDPPASPFNGMFLPIAESLPSKQIDTKSLHSLRTMLSQQGHSDFGLDPSPFGFFPVSSASYASSFDANSVNIDLKFNIPGYDDEFGLPHDAKYQLLRFHFENRGGEIVFETQVMMKYAPNGNTVGTAKGPIQQAGGSVDITYYATTIGVDNDFTGSDASKLLSYATIGGPEFRFVSAN